jgi:hypothetical protein
MSPDVLICQILAGYDADVLERSTPAMGRMNQRMRRYDPMVAPIPEHWLALAEQQRIDLVLAYHRRVGQRAPSEKAHAIIHAIVENQIADDTLPVRRIAQRLKSEGLDRHEAIHAIGSVLAGHINDLMRAAADSQADVSKFAEDSNVAYFSELDQLTAEAWRRSG